MRKLALFQLVIVLLFAAPEAGADQEASNRAHVAAAPYGQCYAKSVPNFLYDPDIGPRQTGRTEIFRVERDGDRLVESYDWFSQQIFLICDPVGISVVRIGPWQRGHTPLQEHLALAFYRDGDLVRRYSTREIAGEERSATGISPFKNASASVSHYTVFSVPPELVRLTVSQGAVFSDDWIVRAVTVDDRVLDFDVTTGEIR